VWLLLCRAFFVVMKWPEIAKDEELWYIMGVIEGRMDVNV